LFRGRFGASLRALTRDYNNITFSTLSSAICRARGS
jgi:hypothetical protein